MRIRVFISCMDRAWAEGVRAALGAVAGPGGQGAGPAVTCVDAAARPDVVLMDSAVDARDTRERLARAVACAASGVLVAYERCTRDLLVEALECGARGCMLKATPASVLPQALCAIRRGESWFSSAALLQALGAEPRPAPPPEPEEHELTPREHQILSLIGEGMSNKEIGKRLEISDHTVKTHLHRVYVKLNRSGRYKAFLAQPAAWHADAAPLRDR